MKANDLVVEATILARKFARLVRGAGRDKNEATVYPFWVIAIKGGAVIRRPVMLAGFWFSREAAEAHLKAKAHRYPKKAFVYCESGHSSTDVRKLYDCVDEFERLEAGV